MAFDYAEYQAFVQLLYKHPELRAEVRKLVLSDDILTLPQVVRELSLTVKELAEAQKRTGQRVEELAEAQKRTDERLTRVEQRMDSKARSEGRQISLSRTLKFACRIPFPPQRERVRVRGESPETCLTQH